MKCILSRCRLLSEVQFNIYSHKYAGNCKMLYRNMSSDTNQTESNNTTPKAASESTSNQGGDTTSSHGATPDFETLILDASLKHVPEYGWSHMAISEAAKSLGYSAATAGLWDNPQVRLINHFYDQSKLKLIHQLEGKTKVRNHEKFTPRLEDYLHSAVTIRLMLISPYMSKWSEARGILALPQNITQNLHNVSTLIDEIWYQAGCKAVDNSWYRKRLALGAVYEASELYMLQDKSVDYSETSRFVRDRIRDMASLHQCVHAAGTAAENMPKFIQGTLSTLQNITGLRFEQRN